MKRPYGAGQHLREVGQLLRPLAHARRAAPQPPARTQVRTRGGSDGLTRARGRAGVPANPGRGGRAQAGRAGGGDPHRRPGRRAAARADRDRGRAQVLPAELESMQRVHISPALGKRKVAAVTTEDVERLASRMLARGASPKTVRNVMTFLHSVFGLAVRKGWAPRNPVEDAARPKRRRAGDADPDLQFLTPAELDRVIDVIPDHVVDKDALGPVMRIAPARRRHDRPAPVRAARPALARRGHARAARARAQRVGPLRALGRGQVGPEHQALGADDRPADRRAARVAAAHGLRRRRGPRLRAPRPRRPARSHEGHAQVQGGLRGRPACG